MFTDQPVSSTLAGNDGDPDGDVITVIDSATGAAATAPVTFTTAQGGTAVVQPDGSFTYTPPTGFIGVDTFDYSVTDADGAVDDATVTLTVQPDPDVTANDAPDANDDSVITQLNTPMSGNALDNDTDPNLLDMLTVTSVDGITFIGSFTTTTNSGGTLQIFNDGSYVCLLYTSDAADE